MSWWFIGICILLLILVVGYFVYIGKRKTGIKMYKEQDMFQILPIREIEYDAPSEIISILAEIEVDGIPYFLNTSCFLPLVEGARLQEDAKAAGQNSIKVWIDPKKLSLFEMDIKSYVESIYPNQGKSKKIEVLGTGDLLKEEYYTQKN